MIHYVEHTIIGLTHLHLHVLNSTTNILGEKQICKNSYIYFQGNMFPFRSHKFKMDLFYRIKIRVSSAV